MVRHVTARRFYKPFSCFGQNTTNTNGFHFVHNFFGDPNGFGCPIDQSFGQAQRPYLFLAGRQFMVPNTMFILSHRVHFGTMKQQQCTFKIGQQGAIVHDFGLPFFGRT